MLFFLKNKVLAYRGKKIKCPLNALNCPFGKIGYFWFCPTDTIDLRTPHGTFKIL